MRPLVDTFIERAAIDAPADDRQPFAFEPAERAELDLSDAGVSTVIWSTGYRLAYEWIDLPIFDVHGFPRHRRGVSEVRGLYFIGMPWQHTMASATLAGVTLDGPDLASSMGLLGRPPGGQVAAS